MNIVNNCPIIIGIDHGYGNIKTANCCFKTGVAAFDKEPTFKSNLLVFGNRYYLIGEEHKEFTADKMADSDYYILTLAAIGRELSIRKQTSARAHIAAGLPLTWVSEQKNAFKQYLLQRAARILLSGVWSTTLTLPGQTFFPRALPPSRTNSGTSRV